MKYIILVFLLTGIIACSTTGSRSRDYAISQPYLTDTSALDLYEVAFRYQFAHLHHPSHIPAYISIEGHAPSDALLRRLSTAERPVLAWREGLSPGVRAYWLQLGTTTNTHSYVIACDSRHDYMRGYTAERRAGRWSIIDDEIVTIS